MSVEIISGAEDTSFATMLSENIFEDGTLTVSSETTDGAFLNCVEDTTFDFWTGGVAAYNAVVDYGTSVECDCLGIAAHTMGTDGSTVTLSYSADGVSYTNAFSFSPLTDETLMFVFEGASARYWRIAISDGPSSIGVIKLGKRLVMPSGVLSGRIGINHSNTVELLTNESIKGQFLGTRIKRIGATSNIDFGMIETDFADNNMAVFEAHFNSGRTFFFASSPDEWPEDYGYCWRSGDVLRISYDEGGTLSSVSMSVSAYVEQ